MIAKSFERIHRSNLAGMGIIPLCFKAGEDADTLGLTGHERYTVNLPTNVSEIKPGQDVTVTTDNGKAFTCTLRFDTEVFLFFSMHYSLKLLMCILVIDVSVTDHLQVELAYYDHGGILPYVIRKIAEH